jgi:hypothetical protein
MRGMPYTWQFAVLVALQAGTVAIVRAPRTLPGVRRQLWLGLLPLIVIGGGVVALTAVPAAVGWVTALATFAVPPLALLAVLHVRRGIVPLAALSPLVWLVAWRMPATLAGDLAADLLIVLAAATLGCLTGMVAPRAGIAVGILVATAVDIWQVTNLQVQPVAAALAAATPPGGLPGLQELTLGGASMGWGDAYLAALLGVIVAARPRTAAIAAAATLVGGLAFALLFAYVDFLPATVPVAIGLLAAGVVERRAVLATVRRWRISGG